jgi:hypothetical protein
VHVARPAHGNAVFTLFSRHAPPKLECRMNRNRSRIPYPGERRQRSNRLRRQSPQ